MIFLLGLTGTLLNSGYFLLIWQENWNQRFRNSTVSIITGNTSSALGNQVSSLLVVYIMGYIIGMSQQNRKTFRQQSSERLRHCYYMIHPERAEIMLQATCAFGQGNTKSLLPFLKSGSCWPSTGSAFFLPLLPFIHTRGVLSACCPPRSLVLSLCWTYPDHSGCTFPLITVHISL